LLRKMTLMIHCIKLVNRIMANSVLPFVKGSQRKKVTVDDYEIWGFDGDPLPTSSLVFRMRF
jgi:hypothetical protein